LLELNTTMPARVKQNEKVLGVLRNATKDNDLGRGNIGLGMAGTMTPGSFGDLFTKILEVIGDGKFGFFDAGAGGGAAMAYALHYGATEAIGVEIQGQSGANKGRRGKVASPGLLHTFQQLRNSLEAASGRSWQMSIMFGTNVKDLSADRLASLTCGETPYLLYSFCDGFDEKDLLPFLKNAAQVEMFKWAAVCEAKVASHPMSKNNALNTLREKMPDFEPVGRVEVAMSGSGSKKQILLLKRTCCAHPSAHVRQPCARDTCDELVLMNRRSFGYHSTKPDGNCGFYAALQTKCLSDGSTLDQATRFADENMPWLRQQVAALIRSEQDMLQYMELHTLITNHGRSHRTGEPEEIASAIEKPFRDGKCVEMVTIMLCSYYLEQVSVHPLVYARHTYLFSKCAGGCYVMDLGIRAMAAVLRRDIVVLVLSSSSFKDRPPDQWSLLCYLYPASLKRHEVINGVFQSAGETQELSKGSLFRSGRKCGRKSRENLPDWICSWDNSTCPEGGSQPCNLMITRNEDVVVGPAAFEQVCRRETLVLLYRDEHYLCTAPLDMSMKEVDVRNRFLESRGILMATQTMYM
jgi:hypothetical protein